MSERTYAELPDEINGGELRYQRTRHGLRLQMVVTLVTTLIDADIYPATKLAEPYRKRWQVEFGFQAHQDHNEDGHFEIN